MLHLKIKYNSEVIKRCSVAVSYITYKWQPSLNKIHAHGNDIRPVKRKQNCTFSEKWASIMV